MTEKLTAEPSVIDPATAPTTTFPELPGAVLSEMSVKDEPTNIRSLSLVILAGLGCVFVLHWAKAIFIPVMLSLLFSYALSPVVNWLEVKKIPRWLSAGVLLLVILASAGATAYVLSDEAAELVESLPAAAAKFAQNVKAIRGKTPSTLETMQKAATQIEQAAQDTNAPTTPGRGVMRVVVEPPKLNVRDYLWTGTLGLVALLGQATAVIFLTYFLMLSGDTFRRKLLKLAGPRLSSKKVTLQALHEITDQIRRYLQMQLLTSALVGVLTGLALWAIGLENAAAWGVLAGILNLVPYLGSLAMTGASALVGFLQFGSVSMALVVGGASLVIHAVIGNLLTPWLTSRTSQLSPVAVFVGLLAWGWLWGVWGLLLGVPILMIVKAVCDRVEDLKPIGEFLGS
jgi:predicted PurR-regulated permease PerM